MNWEAISAIGQLVGAGAVVATLIYLAVQVRHAKLAAADNNRLVRAQGVREYFLQATTCSEMRAANNKAWGMEAFYEQVGEQLEITADEASMLENCNAYWFWLHWGQFTSTTEKRDLAELKHMVRKFYTAPCVRVFWDTSPIIKPMMDAPFVEFVDELLREEDAQAGASTTPAATTA